MKKFALIILAVSFAAAASAQLEIRPFVGANFSNVSKAPNDVDTKAKLGYQIGAGLMIGNRLYVNPSIAYFSRKTEYSTTAQNVGNLNFDQTMSGVIIPVLVGYRFIDQESDPFLNLRIFAGPSFMYLSTTKYENGEANESIDWNDSQWGAQVGAGLDISIFFVDFGYEFGLTNSNDGFTGENNVFTNFTEVKQNTFYVNAGIRLTLAQ